MGIFLSHGHIGKQLNKREMSRMTFLRLLTPAAAGTLSVSACNVEHSDSDRCGDGCAFHDNACWPIDINICMRPEDYAAQWEAAYA